MRIGKVLKELQLKEYETLVCSRNNQKRKKERGEYLSFNYCKHLMEEGSVYKRSKGGAYRQIK